MRTILILYLINRLGYEENTATMAFHLFAMTCYFTPLAGAMIADTLLGKYWTILIISCIYVVGSCVIAFSSISGSSLFTMIGLTLIAIGTGGIKPCVAAFGGDQFISGQELQLQRFFSFFYISINSGSLISTFLTPILREDIACLGQPTCYPLAFGIPAILMIVSLALFVFGRISFGYRILPPQKDNIIIIVLKCIFRGITGKISSSQKREHWLDYADSHYDRKTINEIKTLMRILFLYIPLPIFWALFDQQSSRWTLQALQLNGDFGFYTIKPDQIQVINPVLIVTFIPIFGYIIYPLCDRIYLDKPLRRMVVGGLLAFLSFMACGILQTNIEKELPSPMENNKNHIMAITNKNITDINVNYTKIDRYKDSLYLTILENVPRNEIINVLKNISIKNDQTIFIYGYSIFIIDNVLTKPSQGGAQIFTIFDLNNYNNQSFKIDDNTIKINQYNQYNSRKIGLLNKVEIETKGKTSHFSVGNDNVGYNLDQGATYIHFIVGDMNNDNKTKKLNFTLFEIVPKNQLSVLWQLIQYILITAAEIMFSVTGLEFSYSQSPKSMKSIIQAAWLFNVTIGNLIVAIIADVNLFGKQSLEFYFFGFLMLIDILIFAVQAYFYIPYDGQEHYDSEPNDNYPESRSRVWSMISTEGELPKLNPIMLDENPYDHNATFTSKTKITPF